MSAWHQQGSRLTSARSCYSQPVFLHPASPVAPARREGSALIPFQQELPVVLDASQPVERQSPEGGRCEHSSLWGTAHLEPLQQNDSVRKELLCPSCSPCVPGACQGHPRQRGHCPSLPGASRPLPGSGSSRLGSHRLLLRSVRSRRGVSRLRAPGSPHLHRARGRTGTGQHGTSTGQHGPARGQHGTSILPTASSRTASHGQRCQPGMESLSTSLKKKATEHHYRAEVMIAGEQLRYEVQGCTWGSGCIPLAAGQSFIPEPFPVAADPPFAHQRVLNPVLPCLLQSPALHPQVPGD